jgi:hypothetical protein
VNIVLVFVLVVCFGGVIILSGMKADVKYLNECGDPDKVGSILWQNKYYGEDDLCPVSTIRP